MDFDEIIFNKLNKTPRQNFKIKELTPEKTDYFYIKKDHCHNFIKHRLTVMKNDFLSIIDSEISDFKPVNYISKESFYTYGMITNPYGTNLLKDQIYLYSNIDDSNGVFVELDFQYLTQVSIFPGQIVAIKGKNVDGKRITVDSLECIPTMDVNRVAAEKSKLIKMQNLEISVFSGPYNAEILDLIFRSNSTVLALMGPFIQNEDEKLIGSKDFTMNFYEEKFKQWLSENPNKNIIIIPSLLDTHNINVFPQPPFNFNIDRLLCLPNPGCIYINDKIVSFSTLDVASEINTFEYYAQGGEAAKECRCAKYFFKKSKVSRICHHLIYQKTYLPVFPTTNNVSLSVPEALDVKITPNVHVILSELEAFAECVDPAMVVNVGIQEDIFKKTVCNITIPNTNSTENIKVKFKALKEF